jgi:hypothetical protein
MVGVVPGAVVGLGWVWLGGGLLAASPAHTQHLQGEPACRASTWGSGS